MSQTRVIMIALAVALVVAYLSNRGMIPIINGQALLPKKAA